MHLMPRNRFESRGAKKDDLQSFQDQFSPPVQRRLLRDRAHPAHCRDQKAGATCCRDQKASKFQQEGFQPWRNIWSGPEG